MADAGERGAPSGRKVAAQVLRERIPFFPAKIEIEVQKTFVKVHHRWFAMLPHRHPVLVQQFADLGVFVVGKRRFRPPTMFLGGSQTTQTLRDVRVPRILPAPFSQHVKLSAAIPAARSPFHPTSLVSFLVSLHAAPRLVSQTFLRRANALPSDGLGFLERRSTRTLRGGRPERAPLGLAHPPSSQGSKGSKGCENTNI